MKIWTALATLFAILAVSPNAWAEPKTPLYELARRYEAAVENFERIVLQVRGIDRADERLVDRLDDETAKFRLAAKNPRHRNRLFYQWQAVQKLQAQVEQKIFGKYTPNHELIYGWDAVVYQQQLFAEELLYDVENPRHGNTVRRIPTSNAWRDRYFRSFTISGAESPTGFSRLPASPAPR